MQSPTDAVVRIDGHPETRGRLTIEVDGRWLWRLEVSLEGLQLGQCEWVAVDAGGSTYVGEGRVKSMSHDERGAATCLLEGVSRLAVMDQPR